jgi:FkbM family methyltransferase
MSDALIARIGRFLDKPWSEKRRFAVRWVKASWSGVLSRVRMVRRMEPGFLWIAWSDVIRDEVLGGNFERAERRFVQRYLQRGMTVLDIGAYYGLYALTASVKVGNEGKVIAFEPSPRQFRRLRWHVRLNRCKNVRVENVAVGSGETRATLYSVGGKCGGYSSLRRPPVEEAMQPVQVDVTTLDNYLREHSIGDVDLMKVDVEGGEFDVFKGAGNLLRREVRPVILCELEDVRTEAWGHKARDVATFVSSFGYTWFKTTVDGSLARLPEGLDRNERNFVAVPAERIEQMEGVILNGPGS